MEGLYHLLFHPSLHTSFIFPSLLNIILVQLYLHHYFIHHWYGFFLEAEVVLTGLLKLRLVSLEGGYRVMAVPLP